ncbi:MAG: hypothetical protein JNJ47_01710 [Alphaproteobacteria bacterium]|nr:hypothetical protein [Alphaproteobacteria bacterium]
MQEKNRNSTSYGLRGYICPNLGKNLKSETKRQNYFLKRDIDLPQFYKLQKISLANGAAPYEKYVRNGPKIAFEKGEEPPIAGKCSGHVNFLVSGRAGVLSTRKVAKIILNNNDFCII